MKINLNDRVNVPPVMDTNADVLAVVAPHRVGAIVYKASRNQGTITRLLVRAIQITVGANGNIDIRYHCTHPDFPGQTGDWHADPTCLFGTVEAAIASAWVDVKAEPDPASTPFRR